jgi:arylsulfatase A-like enzyme
MYEELLRVPLILYGPSVKGPRTVPCVARHIDVVPTLLDLLGIPRPSTMRGVSLTSYFARDAAAGACSASAVIAESPAYGPDSRAVIMNQRKLVVRSDGAQSLFDLRDDSQEHHNLAARRPEVVAALRTILDRESTSAGAQEPATAMNLDEETKRQLRALGYLK